jgi:p-hydroxybenzoate 3-monooxygenase
MKTQVCIIGGGPAGLLLAQLCHQSGIDSIVLERRSRDHVLGRIRAGVLEQGMLGLLERAGVPTRMATQGYPHDGTVISFENQEVRIDFARHTGTGVMVYGQTEVTKDLYAARDACGGTTLHEVEDVEIGNAALDGDAPCTVSFTTGARARRSPAITSPAATGFAASAARRSRRTSGRSSSGSTPLAGWASCRKRRRCITS